MAKVSLDSTWKSGVHHVLPMCPYTSKSEGLLPNFLNSFMLPSHIPLGLQSGFSFFQVSLSKSCMHFYSAPHPAPLIHHHLIMQFLITQTSPASCYFRPPEILWQSVLETTRLVLGCFVQTVNNDRPPVRTFSLAFGLAAITEQSAELE
jgi:hypothetical protein